MNITESKALKEKLDRLVETATEFGNQSEQLANVREDYSEYLNLVAETNESIVALTAECRQCIESIDALIERDLSVGIEMLVDACHNHCQNITDKFEESLRYFNEQKQALGNVEKLFEQMQKALDGTFKSSAREVKDGVSSLPNMIKPLMADLKATQEALASEIELLNQQRGDDEKETRKLIDEKALSISSEIQKLKKESGELLTATESKLLNRLEKLDRLKDLDKLDTLHAELKAIQLQQKKTETIAIVGTIAAAVAAIAAIVGLVI